MHMRPAGSSPRERQNAPETKMSLGFLLSEGQDADKQIQSSLELPDEQVRRGRAPTAIQIHTLPTAAPAEVKCEDDLGSGSEDAASAEQEEAGGTSPKPGDLAKGSSSNSKTNKRRRPEPAEGTIRRPPNAFLLYSAERRPLLRTANPQASNGFLSTLISKEWRSLSETERRPYHEEAARRRAELKAAHPTWRQTCKRFMNSGETQNSKKAAEQPQAAPVPTPAAGSSSGHGAGAGPAHAYGLLHLGPFAHVGSQGLHGLALGPGLLSHLQSAPQPLPHELLQSLSTARHFSHDRAPGHGHPGDGPALHGETPPAPGPHLHLSQAPWLVMPPLPPHSPAQRPDGNGGRSRDPFHQNRGRGRFP